MAQRVDGFRSATDIICMYGVTLDRHGPGIAEPAGSIRSVSAHSAPDLLGGGRDIDDSVCATFVKFREL